MLPMNLLESTLDTNGNQILKYRIGSNVIPSFSVEKEISVKTIESQAMDQLHETFSDILKKEEDYLKDQKKKVAKEPKSTEATEKSTKGAVK